MLQQTRAAAAIPYYEAFLKRFPDVDALARAPESEVLAAWSGLGYYSRARNLRRAAIAISSAIADHGSFPGTLEDIRALPGVGPYTAAAVASIAFGLPHAVLDGNVMRVIARLTADTSDIGSGSTRSRFQQLAQDLLDPRRPAAFNQAMMELGATACLPRNPLCLVCPVARYCEAHSTGRQAHFPVKRRKKGAIKEAVEMVIVRRKGCVLMRQRPAGDRRLAGFWELPAPGDLLNVRGLHAIGEFQHTIVNHHYFATVFLAKTSTRHGFEWLDPSRDGKVPITTMTRKALELLAKCESVVQIRA
jgi:A/G-specific adenine glycosylase